MVIKNRIYISGPRMGTNNSMFGIEKKKSKKVSRQNLKGRVSKCQKIQD